MPRQDLHLPSQHGLGLSGLALGLGLADARDHRESRGERRLGAQAHRLVRLAEVEAPLRVADERALHAELDEHPRPRSRP